MDIAKEIERRTLFLIKARWLLIAGMFIYGSTAALFHQLNGNLGPIINNFVPLGLTYLALIIYNGWYQLSYKRFQQRPKGNLIQIVLNTLLLISFNHYPGGISSWAWVGYLLLIFQCALLLDEERYTWYAAGFCTLIHLVLTSVAYLVFIPPIQTPFYHADISSSLATRIILAVWVAITNFYFAFTSTSLVGIIRRRDKELEDTKGEISALIRQTCFNPSPAKYENPYLLKCWEVNGCQQQDCPAYNNSANLRCWQIAGTFCRGVTHGVKAKELGDCQKCKIYQTACRDEISTLGEQFNNLLYFLENDYSEMMHAKGYIEHVLTWANQMSLKDNLDDALELVTEIIRQATKSQKIAILLLDESKKYLVVKKVIGLTGDSFKTAKLEAGDVVEGKLFKEKKVLYIEDINRWEYIKFCLQFNGLGGFPLIIVYLGTPLNPLGIIGVVSEEKSSAVKKNLDFLAYIADTATVVINNQLNKCRLEETYLNTIEALASAIEAKDRYTEGHSARVSELSLKIGQAIELSPGELKRLKYAGLLHDIGKIVVDLSILSKPGKLTPEEFERIKIHPQIGVQIIQHVGFLKDIQGIIRHHHEWFDGSGYPDGIKGMEIEVGARIITIADAYDAMISDRPYRKALTPEKAVQELIHHSGSQFDPRLVDVLLKQVFNTLPIDDQQAALDLDRVYAL